jgi:xylulokinase
MSENKDSGNLVLGIDLGTQSTKALVYDPNAKSILALVQSPHDIIHRSDGTSEQEAKWWINAITDCLSRLDIGLRRRICAVGVSGQQHGFVPVDSEGRVVYRVKLWNDTTTQNECQDITASFGGTERLISEVGNPMLPGYTAPKVLWLKRHAPEAYAAMSRILLPHDYINFFLTGQYSAEAGDASGTGFLDVRGRQWSSKVLTAIDAERDLRECLAPLVEPHAAVGNICKSTAELLGLPEHARVAAGGGDNMMAAIGTGCAGAGVFTISLGTSGTLFGYSDSPVVDPSGVVAAFCSSTGGWLPLVCTMNCTVATELNRTLFEMPLADIDRLSMTVGAGADGLITLPYFNGERTPNFPRARGCIFGLSPSNYTRAHLVRSAMEAAVFGLRYGQEAFSDLGLKSTSIRLTGGGAKSRVWRQMVADITGCPVTCPSIEETAAFGAALQAYWMDQGKQGRLQPIDALVAEHVPSDGEGMLPDPSAQSIYDIAYREYLEVMQMLKPKFV